MFGRSHCVKYQLYIYTLTEFSSFMRDSTLSRKENLKKQKNSTLEMHQITVLYIFIEAWEHNSDKVSIKCIRLHICNTTYANEERWSSGIPLHITDAHRNTVRTMYIVNMSLFIPHNFIINIDRHLNIYALYNYWTSTSKWQSSVILDPYPNGTSSQPRVTNLLTGRIWVHDQLI